MSRELKKIIKDKYNKKYYRIKIIKLIKLCNNNNNKNKI